MEFLPRLYVGYQGMEYIRLSEQRLSSLYSFKISHCTGARNVFCIDDIAGHTVK